MLIYFRLHVNTINTWYYELPKKLRSILDDFLLPGWVLTASGAARDHPELQISSASASAAGCRTTPAQHSFSGRVFRQWRRFFRRSAAAARQSRPQGSVFRAQRWRFVCAFFRRVEEGHYLCQDLAWNKIKIMFVIDSVIGKKIVYIIPIVINKITPLHIYWRI